MSEITSALENRSIDISEEDFYATITERHSGESWIAKISKLNQYNFVANGDEYTYSEMDFGSLTMVCNFVLSGEW